MSGVRAWLVEWFVDNAGIERAVVEAETAENYLDRGWVDSFDFVVFIGAMEEGLGVAFDNDEFQDRTFATVDGLVEIIERKRAGGDS